MLPNWDNDSPKLRRNLDRLLHQISDEGRRRNAWSSKTARQWHEATMEGLKVPDSKWVGRFRGQPGVKKIEVRIGGYDGVASAQVNSHLADFDGQLSNVLNRLDQQIPVGVDLSSDQLAAILEVCAWAHCEWVRIHPFANGNGRTARLWANAIAMRYGLPPFVTLRPRPNLGYGAAAEAAMTRDWQPMVEVFDRMLKRALR